MNALESSHPYDMEMIDEEGYVENLSLELGIIDTATVLTWSEGRSGVGNSAFIERCRKTPVFRHGDIRCVHRKVDISLNLRHKNKF